MNSEQRERCNDTNAYIYYTKIIKNKNYVRRLELILKRAEVLDRN